MSLAKTKARASPGRNFTLCAVSILDREETPEAVDPLGKLIALQNQTTNFNISNGVSTRTFDTVLDRGKLHAMYCTYGALAWPSTHEYIMRNRKKGTCTLPGTIHQYFLLL